MAEVSNEMTEELYQKCQQAASYLKQDIFMEMFQALDSEYVYNMRTADTPERREFWWHRLQALNDVHTGFRILAEKKEAWDAQQARLAAQNEKYKGLKLAE